MASRIFAIAALAGLTAGPALSLSCMRPDPVRAFGQAAASEDRYVVLYGSFAFDGSAMPSFDDRSDTETIDPVPATFSGMALNTDGFTIPYTTDLWLQPTCAGIWCGGMQPADDVLAFVRDRGDGTYELELGPCPAWAFFDPSAQVLDRMAACLAGTAECDPGR
ncbi:hypothetical protein JQU41_14205 [Ponticoccus sp. SC6-36]|nr:hypothetical protein [Ponticoccus sp. SC6-36]